MPDELNIEGRSGSRASTIALVSTLVAFAIVACRSDETFTEPDVVGYSSIASGDVRPTLWARQ